MWEHASSMQRTCYIHGVIRKIILFIITQKLRFYFIPEISNHYESYVRCFMLDEKLCIMKKCFYMGNFVKSLHITQHNVHSKTRNFQLQKLANLIIEYVKLNYIDLCINSYYYCGNFRFSRKFDCFNKYILIKLNKNVE